MKKSIFFLLISMPMLSMAQLTDSTKRLVHMEGAVNFRDIGGYKTLQGKEVVWNKLFRSADISKLTDKDLTTLQNKHIHTVVDFRGKRESAAAPDHLLAQTDYILCPAGSDSIPDMKQMAILIKEKGFLNKFYGSEGLPYFGPRYKPFFQKLLTLPDTSAILYHCSGGRDRTGMATALLLYSLGVPDQKIEEDFTASNIYLASMNNRMSAGLAKASGMSPEEVAKEMELRPELLRTFFTTIKSRYGSVENFMDKELGVGPKEVAALRNKYTH